MASGSRPAISGKRMTPGPPGVFGMDEIDIIVAGHSDGGGVRFMYWLLRSNRRV